MEQSPQGWEDHLVEGEDLVRASETPSECLLSLPAQIRVLPYYHGFWPRRDAEDMCVEPGDFLLRRARISIGNERLCTRRESYEELLNTSLVGRQNAQIARTRFDLQANRPNNQSPFSNYRPLPPPELRPHSTSRHSTFANYSPLPPPAEPSFSNDRPLNSSKSQTSNESPFSNRLICPLENTYADQHNLASLVHSINQPSFLELTGSGMGVWFRRYFEFEPQVPKQQEASLLKFHASSESPFSNRRTRSPLKMNSAKQRSVSSSKFRASSQPSLSNQPLPEVSEQQQVAVGFNSSSKNVRSRRSGHPRIPGPQSRRIMPPTGPSEVRIHSSNYSPPPKLRAFHWGIALTVRVSADCVEHIAIPRLVGGFWMINRIEETENLGNYINHYMATSQALCFGDGSKIVYLKNPIPRCDWQYPHERVKIAKGPVGKGSFGTVYFGYILIGENRALRTAIKCLPINEQMKLRQEISFVEEAKIMRFLEHPNIVKFRGIAIQEIPLMLLMEWCENGDLKHVLKESGRTWPPLRRLKHALEAACGLSYLASKGIIHRDIAARNCLFDHSWVLKIADFGMSRNAEILQVEHYLNPIWQSPETLGRNEFSKKTDVWSFGILLYEIYTNGRTPYKDIREYGDFADAIMSGAKPEVPRLMPPGVAYIMGKCHEIIPDDRLPIEDIESLLRALYQRD